ncbi:hypothetical protein D210916BOD24_25060 [Alteromonas sp. D210916BOD_24]|uniref:hypothetical protein n=1 Tax=Alteromonas sp. D210916BOD_24 TaxID=3157618 RepID=UPI00399CC105
MKKTIAALATIMSFSTLSSEPVTPTPTPKEKYNVTVIKLTECPSIDKVLETPNNLISMQFYSSRRSCELSVIHSGEHISGEIIYADIAVYGNGGFGSEQIDGIYGIKL